MYDLHWVRLREKMVDEIKSFQDECWVSWPEALWRIYEFNLSEMQLVVINLQLHLPGKQAGNYIVLTYGIENISYDFTSNVDKYLNPTSVQICSVLLEKSKSMVNNGLGLCKANYADWVFQDVFNWRWGAQLSIHRIFEALCLELIIKELDKKKIMNRHW